MAIATGFEMVQLDNSGSIHMCNKVCELHPLRVWGHDPPSWKMCDFWSSEIVSTAISG